MRKLLRLIIIVLLAYVSYNAYTDSKENGKSFWYNFGHQFKITITEGKEKTTEIVQDVGNGLKSNNK